MCGTTVDYIARGKTVECSSAIPTSCFLKTNIVFLGPLPQCRSCSAIKSAPTGGLPASTSLSRKGCS